MLFALFQNVLILFQKVKENIVQLNVDNLLIKENQELKKKVKYIYFLKKNLMLKLSNLKNKRRLKMEELLRVEDLNTKTL